MYIKNLLQRAVLITPNEVLFHTDLSDADIKNLWSAVIVAEERFIKKAVCKDLYNDLRAKKNVVVTADNISAITQGANRNLPTGSAQVSFSVGDMVNAIDLLDPVADAAYITLWTEYLWKICAECVWYQSMPMRWLQSKTAGEMLANPPIMGGGGQEAGSGQLKDVQWKSSKMLNDRIEPLICAMREYICDNLDLLPKFTCYECPKVCEDDNDQDDQRGISVKGKTPLVLGVYDCTDRRGRWHNRDNY